MKEPPKQQPKQRTFLHYPHDMITEQEVNYRSQGRYHLEKAYEHMGALTPQSKGHEIILHCESAWKYGKDCLDLLPSPRQVVRANYIMGMARVNLGLVDAVNEAIGYFETAIDLTRRLGKQHAYAELQYAAARACYLRLKYGDAERHVETCDAVLRTLTDKTGSSPDLDLDLANLSLLISCRYLLADWSDKDDYLAEARLLAQGAQHPEEQFALFGWLESQFYRLNGQLKSALGIAMSVAQVYGNDDAPEAKMRRARLHGVVADIACDIAESYEDRASSDAGVYIAVASAYAKNALTTAREVKSLSDEYMALLTNARVERITHDDTDRIAAIETVRKQAMHYDDASLLAQAYTALGDEFVARGEYDVAATSYRQGISAVTDGTDIPMQRIITLRHLLNLQEMHI